MRVSGMSNDIGKIDNLLSRALELPKEDGGANGP